ncbi:ornithine decarboxylase [Phycomyces blakesleeanus]|uniref:ornithine decarboxylase n=3 Tax=Phycomyces blakesleeanus TaxID=4837 RepID=A0A167P135_PHYB8|nr:ornithine decarboxylase [Phycomyces blakesleeanus NRRL 1555(-)]OAD77044.1 ornithine decarboxylase [Phycomyces blakesleeanus NRRL 1555(-)]|eukprot:XP_018295084.1 ornithine decarboxylase [Phycomyces blakesleeanus NRRL 1555(-)]
MHTELDTIVLNQRCDSPMVSKTLETARLPNIPVLSVSVKDAIKQKLDSISQLKWESDQENAFVVGDIGEVYRQFLRWKALLPRIEPFFAVKSNPDPMVVKLLQSLGLGFDCASKAEIQIALETGADPSRIIYANPCKQASYIRYAAQQNVAKMTFDNADELYKIKKFYPNAELVLRILTDDSKSLCQLGIKFGAPLDTVDHLLQTAKDLDLNVIGVSFHVGSGCYDQYAFSEAVNLARGVFDKAEAMGFNFSLLDVGGGFPSADVTDGVTFEKIAAVLGPTVDALFPPNIRVIAEPGRYFVASAFTVCTNIIARRSKINNEQPSFMYYVNDGMYGSFNCIIFDHQVVQPHVLAKDGHFAYGEELEEKHYECSVWGPTCDSIDCLNKKTTLPLLSEGDWLYWNNMGAYTVCSSSQFNGFKSPEILYTNTYC